MKPNSKYKIYKCKPARCGKIIPESDKYAFAVLSRILGGACRLTITDGARLIICHSAEPYPVWVWLADDATEQEMNECYRLLKENFTLGTHRFNCKHSLAGYIIKRAAEDGVSMSVILNMLAYGCEKAIEPRAKGQMVAVRLSDLEKAAGYMEDFHNATRLDLTERDSYRERARELILARQLFFLYDPTGEVASMCSYTSVGDISTVSNVYTLPKKRRMGYAARLVYELTEMILSSGNRASIYTDGDYAPSNACYMGIGYEKMGELCTVK